MIVMPGDGIFFINRWVTGKVTFWAKSPLRRVYFSPKSPSPSVTHFSPKSTSSRVTFHQNRHHQVSLFRDFTKSCQNKGHFAVSYQNTWLKSLSPRVTLLEPRDAFDEISLTRGHFSQNPPHQQKGFAKGPATSPCWNKTKCPLPR